jgi:hypothetical protein
VSIQKDIEILLDQFPKLESRTVEKKFIIAGEIDIFDATEIYWDSFKIELIVPFEYPYAFPKMFETSKKIPRIEDRHINQDGSCCVTVLHRELLYSRRGINLLTYVIKFAIPYFANQLFFEKEGRWAAGEYQHGNDGILQFYLEDSGVKSFDELIDILFRFDLYKKCGRNEACICGSYTKFKNCHYDIVKFISFFPEAQRKNDLNSFMAVLLKKEKELTVEVSDINV